MTRSRVILNENKMVDTFKNFRDSGFSSVRISSKFINDQPLEIQRPDDDSKLLRLVHDKVLEYAKSLPHRQLLLKVTKKDMTIEIVINPISGAA